MYELSSVDIKADATGLALNTLKKADAEILLNLDAGLAGVIAEEIEIFRVLFFVLFIAGIHYLQLMV
jgi:hypothetical protein